MSQTDTNVQEGKTAVRSSFNWTSFFIEITIVILAGIFAASVFVDFNPNTRLGGIEAEYLTRTAYPVATLLQRKGYIPLWDPYMELGDPMLENPVAFYFNPVLIGPSLLLGPITGIKISIVLTAIIAGLGGWALARVLGLGPLARLLLALLCIGKGNMYSFLSQGHFAFFAAQAYFPWIYAGVLAIFHGHRRWPPVLIALAFSLIFFTGSPWFPPPLVLTVGILTLFYVIDFHAGVKLSGFWRVINIDWHKLGVVVASLVLTLCLSAVTFLTLWNTRQNIGGTTVAADYQADLGRVLSQYVSGFKQLGPSSDYMVANGFAFYSYVTPLWYGLVVLILLGFVTAVRRRLPQLPWRVMLAGLVIFIFCTLWGAGQNPIIQWFYQVIPLANQFRHVERVLGISALWLAVLVAIVVDRLWVDLVHSPVWIKLEDLKHTVFRRRLRLLLAAALVVTTGFASYDVVSRWHDNWGTYFLNPEDEWENYCITWLRQHYPDQQLSVWTLSYHNIYTYYRNEVRHGFVGSDFYHAQPIPSTIFNGNLVPRSFGPSELLPEFALGGPHFDANWLKVNGYVALPGSADPFSSDRAPCVYRRDNAYSYAFWITRRDLKANANFLPPSAITPITTFVRDYDRIALLAQAKSDADVVVAVQELAYPGWTVQIDGHSAKLELVGGLIGTVLPFDGKQHLVFFQYLPIDFFVGAAITLITAIGCILYLLRADQLLPASLARRFIAQIVEAWELKTPES